MEVLNHLGDALGITLASLGATFHDLLAQSVFFAISMPLCSGIATFEGLGAQVGATWAQKSRPNGLWGALATVLCEVLCRSYGNGRERSQTVANCRELPGTQIKAEVKVYLNDKPY